MVGVLLALILIAVLRNGMQLANLSGSVQDIVIGGLLVSAILVGNALRAMKGRTLPFGRARSSREEVNRPENDAAAPVGGDA